MQALRCKASAIASKAPRRVAENREQIEALARLQACMEQALARWRDVPENVVDLETLCRFIES
jgi:hypothetical protein